MQTIKWSKVIVIGLIVSLALVALLWYLNTRKVVDTTAPCKENPDMIIDSNVECYSGTRVMRGTVSITFIETADETIIREAMNGMGNVDIMTAKTSTRNYTINSKEYRTKELIELLRKNPNVKQVDPVPLNSD